MTPSLTADSSLLPLSLCANLIEAKLEDLVVASSHLLLIFLKHKQATSLILLYDRSLLKTLDLNSK